MKGYIKLRKRAKELLENKLSGKLTYHKVQHTLDVLENVNFLIRKMNVSPSKAKLLRIAALYHDIGFTRSYRDHEEHGVEILRAVMEEYNCDRKVFEEIASMIMATKIPQSPKNKLENIICDADLFYLGGKNYYEISKTLFQELKNFKLIKGIDEWNKVQVKFLSTHSYHTKIAKELMDKGKKKRLVEISQDFDGSK